MQLADDKTVRTVRVESLLREAAEWEPAEPAPPGFAVQALARLEDPDPCLVPRRAASPFIAMLLGGGAISTVLAGGILAVGLPARSHDPLAMLIPIPKRLAPATLVRAESPPSPPHSPAARNTGGISRPAPRRLWRAATATAVRRPEPAAPMWRTEHVEREEVRMIAPALLLQPDGETGDLLVRTGVIDLPPAVACRPLPVEGPEHESVAVAEPPASPTGPIEDPN